VVQYSKTVFKDTVKNFYRKTKLLPVVFTIHPFKPENTFDVITLASRVLTEQYNPTFFNYFYEYAPWGFWVVETHQNLVGFIVCIQQDETRGKILMIGVEESYRKQGIGSALLKQVLKTCMSRHITSIELEVATQNTSAIAFYKRHGFRIIETIPSFYQNNDAAHIMRWDIPG